MKFAEPHIFYYIAFVLAVGTIFFIWSGIRYKNASTRFAEDKLLKKIDPYYDDKILRLRMFLNIVAIFFIGIALSRPQWGVHWEEKKNKCIDILVALDTSKSMLAQDVGPDRFEYAKAQIADFVKGLEGDRVGLIAFSGDAFLYCPFTMDYSGFITSLNNVKVGSIARGGTSIIELVTEAGRAFKWAISKNKILIIVSDGEDTEGSAKKAASQAKSDRIQISCVGIGTKEGAAIPYVDEKGNKAFVKDESGKVVNSRLDENTLKLLASETGGSYAHSSPGHPGLDFIYEKALSKLRKQENDEVITRSYSERFQIPLIFALTALFLEMTLAIKKRNEDI